MSFSDFFFTPIYISCLVVGAFLGIASIGKALELLKENDFKGVGVCLLLLWLGSAIGGFSAYQLFG